MISVNGKPIDLTNPASWNQPGVSITLKPGGSITTVKDGVTTVVKRDQTSGVSLSSTTSDPSPKTAP